VRRCTGCTLEDQRDKRMHSAEDNYRLAQVILRCECADTLAQRLENRQEIGRRMAKIHSCFKKAKNNSHVSCRIKKKKKFTELQVI